MTEEGAKLINTTHKKSNQLISEPTLPVKEHSEGKLSDTLLSSDAPWARFKETAQETRQEENSSEKKTVIALGMFDGMHIGHRKLIDTAVLIANARGMIPTVYTFSNHPQELFGVNVRRLCTNEQRRSMMRSMGVVRIEEIEFTDAARATTPERFVQRLIRNMNAGVLVAGFNYTFGRGKVGNPDMLQRFAYKHGADTAIIPPVTIGKSPVSSTRIRSMIESGDVFGARDLLGRAYSLEGTVVENRKLGRTIGFPTANIAYDPHIVLPGDGVYITIAEVMGSAHPAITNIGSNPTVGGAKTTVETHILSFDGDIYGQELKINFIKRMRLDRRFDSLDSLRAQIEQDVNTASTYFDGAFY